MTTQLALRIKRHARVSLRKLKSIGLFLFVLILACPSVVPAQAQEPDMAYVGLGGYGVYAVSVAPDGQVVVGTSSGIWRATADGRQISQMSGDGLPVVGCSQADAPTDGSEQCFVPSVAVNSRGDVFAVVMPGWRRGRLHIWHASASGWQPVPEAQMMLDGDDSATLVAVAPDDTVYFAAKDYRDTCGYTPCVVGAVYRSTDDGETWAEVEYGGYWETVDAIDVGPAGQVWLGGGNLGGSHWMGVSSDGGTSWATSTVIPPTGDTYPGTHVTTDFAFGNQGDVYITTAGGAEGYPLGVYHSSDDGLSWQRLTPADISQQLGAIALSGDDHIVYSSWGGILRSTDGGASWTALTYPPTYPATYVVGLLVDYDGYLWAATESKGMYGAGHAGLYRSALPVGSGRQLPPGRSEGNQSQTPEPSASVELLNNWNVAAVHNDPWCEPRFTISQPHHITYIDTYHWNNGSGTPGGGTIGLVADDGTVYGPWQVSSTQPVYQAEQAIWIVNPDTTIPAGSYVVRDSDPSTWSHNGESGGCGFSKVLGQAAIQW
jgi:hypothetical protein